MYFQASALASATITTLMPIHGMMQAKGVPTQNAKRRACISNLVTR